MKGLKNKTLFKRIIVIMMLVIVIGTCFTGKVQAKGEDKGGKLLGPVADLISFIGDGLMNIVHNVIFNQSDTTIPVDRVASWLEKLATVLAFVVIAVVVAVAVVVSAGAVAAAAAAIGVTVGSIGAGTVLAISVTAGVVGAAVFNAYALPDVLEIPVYQISPAEIFSNKIALFDVNFFNPRGGWVTLSPGTENERQVFGEYLKDKTGKYVTDDEGNPVFMPSAAGQLRNVVSSWYNILRDIAVVALLSVLVYTGIRIVISSTASDKSKYKQMLIDWVVALCLLFVMQYIMSFANMIVEKVTDVLANGMKQDLGYIALIDDSDGKISDALEKEGYGASFETTEIDGTKFINLSTNVIGVARLNSQMARKQSASYAGFAVVFLALVFFTIYFIFTYLRRVLYMAFLTLIAPLVAMTYPIDKMNDGKAQAFNMWFKEYIFNLLIQPMHLLLYTILVSSAFELASTNIIYTIVAIAFMIPSEKLLRSFFGFEKAKTPGLLAGPAGAALAMGGMQKLLNRAPKDEDRNKNDDKNPRIKYKDKINTDQALYGGSDSSGAGGTTRTMPIGDGDNGDSGGALPPPSGGNNGDDGGSGGGNMPPLPGGNDGNGGGSLPPPSGDDGEDDDGYDDGNGGGSLPPPSGGDDGYDDEGDDGALPPPSGGDDGYYEDDDEDEGGTPPRQADIPEGEEEEPVGMEDTNLYKFGQYLANGAMAKGKPYVDGAKYIGNRVKNSKPVGAVKKVGRKIKNSPVGRIAGAVGQTVVPTPLRKAAAAGIKYYAKGLGAKAVHSLKNAHLGKKAIRLAGGAALGATAAGVGLALGVTSGDPTKTLQYTGALGLAGYKAGSGTAGKVASALTVDGSIEAMNKATMTEEQYKQRQIKKRVKEVQKDERLEKELARRLESDEKAKKALEEITPEAVRFGLDKANEIAAIYNRVYNKDASERVDVRTAVAQVKAAKDFGKDTRNLGHKDRTDFEKTIGDKVAKNRPSLSATQKTELQEKVIKMYDSINSDLYNNVTM